MSGAGFFFGDAPPTLADIKMRQALAQALLQRGMQEPGSTPYGGLANAVNEIAGAYVGRKANQANAADYAKQLGAMLGSNQPNPVTVTPQIKPDASGAPVPNDPSVYNQPAQTFNPSDTATALGMTPDRAKLMAGILGGLEPEQGRQALTGVLESAIQPHGIDTVTLSNGQIQRIDKLTGAPIGDPIGPAKLLEMDPAKWYLAADQPGPPPQAGTPAPVPTPSAPGQAAPPPAAGSVAGRNLANNNPGNMRIPGQAAFQSFPDMQTGINAVGHQIGLYVSRGNNTIQGIVSTYAPKADHNDTAAYIARVSQLTGLDPTKPIASSDIPKIRDAMITVEQGGVTPAQLLAGGQPPQMGGQPTQAPQPPVQGGIPGYHIVHEPQQIWRTITDPKEAARYNVTPGSQINTVTGEIKPRSMSDIPVNASDPAIQAMGASYWTRGGLSGGTARDAASLRAIRAAAIQYGMQQNPGMTPEQAGVMLANNEVQFKGRERAISGFMGTGVNSPSSKITAANNAVGHLGALAQLADALQSGQIPVINAARQRFQQEMGYEAPTNFDALARVIGPEVIKSIVPGGGGEAERNEVINTLKRNGSPQQVVGAIQQYLHAIGRQVYGTYLQYRANVPDADPNDFAKRFLAPDVAPYFLQAAQQASGDGHAPSPAAGGPAPKVVHWNDLK